MGQTEDVRRHVTCASCGSTVSWRATAADPERCDRCGAWLDDEQRPPVAAVRPLDAVPAG